MELRVLRYFLAVAREGSITRAAQVLHLTQPTLSRQLAQLEESLGVSLFERGKKKLALTGEGMLLRRRAEEILELADKTEQELLRRDEQVEGAVAIGCGDLKAARLLPELIRTFHEKYPRVTFEIYTANADHIKDRMDRGLTDIGLLLEPVDMGKYEFIRLEEKERWVAALHPAHPLAAREYLTPEDLTCTPLILPSRQEVRSELASWFGDAFPRLQVLMTSNLPSNSSVIVESGLACAVIIGGSRELWDPAKIVCRPLRPELTAVSALAWKREKPFGPAAEKFIGHIKSYRNFLKIR